MDPLAEMYPNISSYAYVGNNPINYIDPDGNRIFIGKNRKNYLYENGKLYDTKGNLYTGDDEFLNTTRDALWKLDMTGTHYVDTGNAILKRTSIIHKLVEEDNNYIINYTKDKKTFGVPKKSNVMIVNHKSRQLRAKIRTEKGLIKLTYEVALAHELGHIFSNVHGFSKDAKWFDVIINKKGDIKSPTLDEHFAMYFENIFRDYLGIPRRTHYNELDVSKAYDPRPYDRSHIYNSIKGEKSTEPVIKPAPKPKAYLSPRYF